MPNARLYIEHLNQLGLVEFSTTRSPEATMTGGQQTGSRTFGEHQLSRWRLHGHKIWKFSEKPRSGIATLIKVNAICTVCHSIQHWGRTKMLIAGGLMSMADGRRLIRHFMKVDHCARAAFDRHERRVTAEWLTRSKKRWKIDWGQFKPAVEEAAAARERWHRS